MYRNHQGYIRVATVTYPIELQRDGSGQALPCSIGIIPTDMLHPQPADFGENDEHTRMAYRDEGADARGERQQRNKHSLRTAQQMGF